MNGKSKCKILKDIRRQIAEDNDIEYITTECKYQGDCSGTCPKCEAELRYLENELSKRQAVGKAVAVAGIAVTLVLGASACGGSSENTDGSPPYPESSTTEYFKDNEIPGEETEPIDEVVGALPVNPTEELAGVPAPPFYEGEPGVDDGDWGTLH